MERLWPMANVRVVFEGGLADDVEADRRLARDVATAPIKI